MNFYIITGTSKGLGESIARELLQADNHLFCISRTLNDALISEAALKNCLLNYIQQDLCNTSNLPDLMQHIFLIINKTQVNSISLINNAGTVAPVKPVGQCHFEEISAHIALNITAPVTLCSEFFKHTQKFTCNKMIINISSGASKKPYHGWSCYCSSKAALDMFTRTAALEQSNLQYPVKLISIAPGIVDTDMQTLLRNTPSEDFPQVERFIAFKKNNKLLSPESAAKKVLKISKMNDIINGGIYDIRDFFDLSFS